MKILLHGSANFSNKFIEFGHFEVVVFFWWMIDNDLCDLKILSDGALFCSLEE
jgi:hypothetical protein